jgi:hypothetical protein
MNTIIPLILILSIILINTYNICNQFNVQYTPAKSLFCVYLWIGGLSNLLGKQLPDDGNGPKHVGAS